jgi:type II secretory pathway pseudopilin PulG
MSNLLQTGAGRLRREGESGFMLVFAVVLVALVLIALAVAAPVVAKELRRDKEVESMHRMQQYVRAIQLYQRACKCTNYPPSMDALEKGTNVRYLRKEWVDPLTGKSDWRLIHNPQTTVKGFFGQELTGLSAGLGSAAGLASNGGPSNATSGTSVNTGCNASNSVFCQQAPTTSTSGSSGSTGSTGSSDTGIFGDSSGGPIKGVGTARTGSSILTPNDQDTYETWEFWYDPRIELLKKNVNILGGGGPAGASTGSSGIGSTSASDYGNNLNGTPNGPGGSTGSTGSAGTPANPTPQ